jgi:hypothetical protein
MSAAMTFRLDSNRPLDWLLSKVITMKALLHRLPLFVCALFALSPRPMVRSEEIHSKVPVLDHVFLIMVENHGYDQILGNPNAPFINAFTRDANHATNYFAVGHPGLTNYLEIVGGSNFGVLADNDPDWRNRNCSTNLQTGLPQTRNPQTGPVCPIAGVGTDAATPAVDHTNQAEKSVGLNNIDGERSIPANPNTHGETIADQLVAKGLNWKSYQEDLPIEGADLVNFSDGVFTNTTDFSALQPPGAGTAVWSSNNVIALYAVKHNPFAYFRSVQDGDNSNLSLQRMAGFEGPHGLYFDLGAGDMPNFSFIVPDQCNDQHGRSPATVGPFCSYDNSPTTGEASNINPALLRRADASLKKIVEAIHVSPLWKKGKNAIVVVWDENDYAEVATVKNNVLLVIDTNYGVRHKVSDRFYTHFSLLKTIEASFGLPCLNHACDDTAELITDLFSEN